MGRNRYKYIGIDGDDEIVINGTNYPYDFGYGHLFTSPISDQKSGRFYWERVLDTNPVEFAVIIDDSTALYTNNNFEVVHPVSGDTIQTTNNVNEGQVIGPVGNSITSSTVTAHIHLYLFENDNFGVNDATTKNPLQFVTHDEPVHKVEIFRAVTGGDPSHTHGTTTHSNWPRFAPMANDTNILIQYPGTNTSQIVVKTTMDSVANGNSYSNAVMNTDKVGIFISAEFGGLGTSVDPYDTIEGPNFKALIHLDGTINEEDINPLNFKTRGQAQNNRTGMQPWSYSDRRQRPWDFFNFADFATRIHKNDVLGDTLYSADSPEHARYNDGNYLIKASVTDAIGNEFEGPLDTAGNISPLHINVDNFKPYVKDVRVTFSEVIKYRWDWDTFDPNKSVVNDGYIRQRFKFTSPIIGISQMDTLGVSINVSEQMDTMYAVIPNISSDTIIGVFDPLQFPINGANIWNFNFGSNLNLVDSVDYRIHFFGKDTNGNSLLNLSEMASNNINTDNIKIPKER
jgi:hypothetical protein